MKVIHVLRKPLSEGTVASNTLKYGVSGLNIDACRIGTGGEVLSCSRADPYHAADGTQRTWNPTSTRGIDRVQHRAGRWPANLILQHLGGCRSEGTRKVKGQNPKYVNEGRGSKAKGIYGALPSRPAHTGIGHADEDGNETVDNWICAQGCPVKALDAQSGECPSWGVTHQPKRSGYSYRSDDDGGTHVYRPPDTGGASRYFKQVGREDE